MSTAKKITLALCGSALVAFTLFSSLRTMTLTRRVQSLEQSLHAARPETPYVLPTKSVTRQAPVDGTAHKVLRAVDGDTVEIETDTGPLKVRVIGIDTPETVHPSKPVEPGGPEATARARELLEGQTVLVQYDPNSNHDRWDKYGRLLAYLELPDGRDYGLVMVMEGYAAAYVKYPFSRQDSYLKAAPQPPPLEEQAPDPNTDPNQSNSGLQAPADYLASSPSKISGASLRLSRLRSAGKILRQHGQGRNQADRRFPERCVRGSL